MEFDLVANKLDVLELLDGRSVLLVDVDELDTRVIALPLWLGTTGWEVEAEVEEPTSPVICNLPYPDLQRHLGC